MFVKVYKYQVIVARLTATATITVVRVYTLLCMPALLEPVTLRGSMSVLLVAIPLYIKAEILNTSLFGVDTHRIGIITTTSSSFILEGDLMFSFSQLGRDTVSSRGHTPTQFLTTIPKLATNILSQHILGLLDDRVGSLKPKNQHVHVGRKYVLILNMICCVELDRDARKYSCTHLEGGIFLDHAKHCQTIFLVAEVRHVRQELVHALHPTNYLAIINHVNVHDNNCSHLPWNSFC